MKTGDSPIFDDAVDAWIRGDDAAALDGLKELSSAHAGNLLRLIGKPRIEVLGQVRHDASRYYSIADAIARDPKFRLRNLSFHPDDLPLRPYADVHEYCESIQPDFYFCHQIEYQVIPPNLAELSCPILGQTADYDIHIQTTRPWLSLFDAFVVTDETERRDVSGLVSAPVFTFPKMFGVDAGGVDVSGIEKEYDVFISGLLLHPYHPEKAELVNALLRQEDLKVLVVNGMVSEDEYNRLLARSKVCFTFVRHPGAMPSRGIEALHRGCAVVAQNESVLHRYFSEEQGVAGYDSTSSDLLDRIRTIVANWPEWTVRASRGADLVRREFTFETCMSQYFRFLTVVAAHPDVLSPDCRARKQIPDSRKLIHKRVLLSGGVQSASASSLRDIQRQTIMKLESDLQSLHDAATFAGCAREILMAHAGGFSETDTLSRGFQILRTGMAAHSQSLVLRWLFIWSALEWGSSEVILEALDLAHDTLKTAAASWQLDPFDDLPPYDCGNRFLNHRRMIDLMMKECSGGGSTREERTAVLLASIRYIISYHEQSIENIQEAVLLDPDFAVYRLRWITLLLQHNRLDLAAAEKDHLTKHFRASFLPEEAYELLTRYHGLDLLTDGEYAVIRAEYDRIRDRISFVGRRSGLPLEDHWDAIRTVAVFGASVSGRKCADVLRARNKRIAYFLDNAPPNGGTFENLAVLRPQAAVAGLADVDGVVLASAGAKDMMFRQLRLLNYAGPIYDWKE